MARMKTGPKFVLIAAGVAGLVFGGKYAIDAGWVKKPVERAAAVPPRADLPPASLPVSAAVANVPPKADLPAPKAVQPVALASNNSAAPVIRMEIWAWNAQMGLLYANGGSDTAQGSLMDKRGVRLRIARQDDVPQMQADLMTFASDVCNGNPQPERGAHYVAIMGDGAATFLAGINGQLKRLGPDCIAEVIGSLGFSRGEDKFMGPPAWKTNPGAARGSLVAGVLRDGDWNIALKWAGDNGIRNNPNERTWDADAINWVNADNYIDAAQKYVAGYCEDRQVVSGGKLTGETKRACVNGVVTWTPGDVIVATQKGGLASIVSTREYYWQMPNTVIGIRRWNEQNRATVEGFLAAALEGGQAVRDSEENFQRAAVISAQIYKEETPQYWYKYAKGVTEPDKQGLQVELGGSAVNNLADNQQLFGLDPGGINLFQATYEVFGNIVVSQYPDLVPSYPPVSEILNTSFIRNIASRTSVKAAPEPLPKFEASVRVTSPISKRAWSIPFEFGKATFGQDAEPTLQELLQQVAIAGSLALELHGHTDNVGNAAANKKLSEERAFAVKQWLESKSPTNFPSGRIRVFAHGADNPIAPNGSDTGRAQNRRVEVVLGAVG